MTITFWLPFTFGWDLAWGFAFGVAATFAFFWFAFFRSFEVWHR